MCVFVFSTDVPRWEKGVLYAEGQNLARLLMEAPANHLTPTIFANTIEEKVASHGETVTLKKRFVLYSSLHHWRNLGRLLFYHKVMINICKSVPTRWGILMNKMIKEDNMISIQ